MKALTVIGTVAMFMVGGGILVHGMPFLHAPMESAEHLLPWLSWLLPSLLSAVAGVIAGAIVLAGVTVVAKLKRQG
jgi:predicted DNA repair protein MutK